INHPIHPGKKLFRTKEHTEELINYTDINGKPVFTLWKWITESLWFSQFANQHPDVKIINATEGGIGFTGIPNLPLKEVAELYLSQQFDFNARIFGEVQDHPMPAIATTEFVTEAMETFAKSLEKSIALLHTKMNQSIQESVDKDLSSAQVNLDLPLKAQQSNAINDELRDEIAYRFLLKKFEESYNNLYRSVIWRLDLDAEFSSPKELESKRLEFKIQLLTYLGQTAAASLQLIKMVLKFHHDRAQVSTEEASQSLWHSKTQNETTNQAVYSFEEGKLRLFDPEFDLNYEEIFIPDEEGKFRLYDDSGRLKHEYFLRNGKLHGPSRFYNQEGIILAQNWYIDGLLQGKSLKYFSTGELYGIQRFRNGAKHGKQELFYKTGSVRSIIPFKDGVLDGEMILIHDNGVQSRSLYFVGGKRNGIEQFWNKKGLLIIKGEFKDDMPTGSAYLWYDNGALAQEASYGPEGEQVLLKRWTSTGVELQESQWKHLDYFEDIAQQTGFLTNSLSGILEQANVVAQIVSDTGESLKKGEAPNLGNMTEEFASLKQELEKLQAIQELMLYESGLDGKKPDEAIWKTPSIQRELQHKLEGVTKQLKEGVSKLHTSLIHTVDDLKAQQTKKDEQAPPSKDEG
ncbi:MAG: toxin-antitoxin system YwqK family antitoxin, partial [Parachlamydiaceae bacterium]|nr:toxin-antitoxin system YwqK family antitoxin [Parachlamydiaceae bacterium]